MSDFVMSEEVQTDYERGVEAGIAAREGLANEVLATVSPLEDRIAALEAALRPFADIAAAIDDNLDATRAKWDDPELEPPPHLTDAHAEVRFMQWGGDDGGYVELEEFRSELTLADFRAARAALAPAPAPPQFLSYEDGEFNGPAGDEP